MSIMCTQAWPLIFGTHSRARASSCVFYANARGGFKSTCWAVVTTTTMAKTRRTTPRRAAANDESAGVAVVRRYCVYYIRAVRTTHMYTYAYIVHCHAGALRLAGKTGTPLPVVCCTICCTNISPPCMHK